MIVDPADLLFSGRGSSALWAVLKSLNRVPARILLPVNICEIVYPIILKAGYKPVFYDVDGETGNARLDDIRNAFTGEETVLIAVHNFGAPLEIDAIARWAEERNIFLIEDVCNAIGAGYKERPLGTFGDAALFSFGYAKILEYGLGGAVLIKDAELKRAVQARIASLDEFSEHQKNKDEEYQQRLREIRQTEINGNPSVYLPLYREYSDFLLYKLASNAEKEIRALLNDLNRIIEGRTQKAWRYRNEIRQDKVCHIPAVPGQVYWRYNLLVDSSLRDDLCRELRKHNVLVSTWFPPIVELFEQNVEIDKYPGSKSFGERVINLFVDDRVSHNDVSKAIEVINNC